jgi:hypothetical protein
MRYAGPSQEMMAKEPNLAAQFSERLDVVVASAFFLIDSGVENKDQDSLPNVARNDASQLKAIARTSFVSEISYSKGVIIVRFFCPHSATRLQKRWRCLLHVSSHDSKDCKTNRHPTSFLAP